MKKETEQKTLSVDNKPFSVSTYEKFLKVGGRLTGIYSVISTDPLIFIVARSTNPVSGFKDSFQFLFKNLKNRTAYFLCNWYWHIEKPKHVGTVKDLEDELLKYYPNLRFFHLCNTWRQTEIFQAHHLKAVFCNQNCFLDERIFKPLPEVEKKYDAVYDARFIKFKRHFLAAEIDNLALTYAQNNLDEEDAEYTKKTKKLLSHAYYFDHAESGNYQRLKVEEINRCLNECRVGLCLSAEEGAMYASTQYLLSGLPVVSTESLGGRDVFFDDSYVSIVESTPEAVRQGVEDLISRDISPDLIRQKTIEKMSEHRQRFISLVQNIYQQEEIKRNFQTEWDTIFFNKFLKIQSHLETLKQIIKD